MDQNHRVPYSTSESAGAPRPKRPSGTHEGGDSRSSSLLGTPPGPADYNNRTPPKPRGPPSALQKLKNKVGMLEESLSLQRQAHAQAQHEVQHYKDRVLRDGESHKLEIQRLQREVEYHKRLRLGADQRAYELEERLRLQRRQTSVFDEAQSSLVEQSQLLVSKNSELQYKLQNLEAQVAQQQELQGALEVQLDGALHDRDGLEAELRCVLEQRRDATNMAGGDGGRLDFACLTLEEAEEEGEEEGGDEAEGTG